MLRAHGAAIRLPIGWNTPPQRAGGLAQVHTQQAQATATGLAYQVTILSVCIILGEPESFFKL